MGLYAEWQPIYEAHGVAIFPVRPNKTPAVKGYLRIGSRVSRQLVPKFTETDAFGLACKSNKITVLDVDTTDERVLADGLQRHGQTPFIVRSGSGNFQAWYRHNGERRHVRPDPALPIDILGDGYVVCPPSLSTKGRYEIIQGTLDELDRLPKMRGYSEPQPAIERQRQADRQQQGIGSRSDNGTTCCSGAALQALAARPGITNRGAVRMGVEREHHVCRAATQQRGHEGRRLSLGLSRRRPELVRARWPRRLCH